MNAYFKIETTTGFVRIKMNKVLKIGSRGSPLALAQVEMVRTALAETFPDLQTELVVIKTSGDWEPAHGEVRLSAQDGGKGLFAKEIERALLAGAIDCAVHSSKDMDSDIPSGLILRHYLPRADARDVLLLSRKVKESLDDLPADPFEALPHGATVGTASVRRQAFLLARRPDLNIVPMRGNVQTRIDKLNNDQVDATLLAMAGLSRLGLEHAADYVLDDDDMLPAAGQGAVCIELRGGDGGITAVFDQINHAETCVCVTAERAALKTLDGSCHTPIGAHAVLRDGGVYLRLQVAALDGSTVITQQGLLTDWSTGDVAGFGRGVAAQLKDKIPASMLDQSIATDEA